MLIQSPAGARPSLQRRRPLGPCPCGLTFWFKAEEGDRGGWGSCEQTGVGGAEEGPEALIQQGSASQGPEPEPEWSTGCLSGVVDEGKAGGTSVANKQAPCLLEIISTAPLASPGPEGPSLAWALRPGVHFACI